MNSIVRINRKMHLAAEFRIFKLRKIILKWLQYKASQIVLFAHDDMVKDEGVNIEVGLKKILIDFFNLPLPIEKLLPL